MNLLENAYKYTPDDGAVKVTIDQDMLIVADTGVGIHEKYLEEIWDPFWQADKSR
jgi:signal transduction histidine kinase